VVECLVCERPWVQNPALQKERKSLNEQIIWILKKMRKGRKERRKEGGREGEKRVQGQERGVPIEET
jgi:hypothetical protein